MTNRFFSSKFRSKLFSLLILLTCCYGSLSAISPGSFFADGDKARKAVALTFDDGPGKFTKDVLNILDQYKVKATFFMNGDQVELYPELAREISSRGHEIADHTYSHVNFYWYEKSHGLEKTKQKIREEIKRSKEVIEKVTGVIPQLCRMPHGYHRPWLKEIAKEFNYILVNWSFGEDWQNVSEQKMIDHYIQHTHPGAILLFHDGGKNREKTIQALPKIIQEGQKKDLSFLKVTDIIEPNPREEKK